MTRKTKVMYLIKGLGAGGAERLLSTSIPHLDRTSYDYEVTYLLPGKNDLVPEFTRANIPVFCLGLDRPYDLRAAVRLVKLLRQRQVDVLHIHLPYAGILGRISSRFAGVRTVVYTEHNVHDMYHPLTRIFSRLTYPIDDATITVSDEVQRSLLQWKVLRPKRSKTITGGVDIQDILYRSGSVQRDQVKASLNIPQDHLVVGNVAHIRPEKGQEYLIEAAAQVIKQHPRTTFIIVGREKQEGAVKQLQTKAAALDIEDRVLFAGFQDDVAAFFSIFDVFTLSSLYEGLPVSLLEAMVVGVPAVVTTVGGLPEVIQDGSDGFLVAPRDVGSLAEKIGALLEDPDMRRTMGVKAAGNVKERFNIQSMVASIEEVYAEALMTDGKHRAEVA